MTPNWRAAGKKNSAISKRSVATGRQPNGCRPVFVPGGGSMDAKSKGNLFPGPLSRSGYPVLLSGQAGRRSVIFSRSATTGQPIAAFLWEQPHRKLAGQAPRPAHSTFLLPPTGKCSIITMYFCKYLPLLRLCERKARCMSAFIPLSVPNFGAREAELAGEAITSGWVSSPAAAKSPNLKRPWLVTWAWSAPWPATPGPARCIWLPWPPGSAAATRSSSPP